MCRGRRAPAPARAGPDRRRRRRACWRPEAPGLAYTPAFSPDGRVDRLLALEAGRASATSTSTTSPPEPIARSPSIARWTSIRASRPTGATCCGRRTAPASTTSTRYELATAQLYQVTNVAVGAFQPVGLDRRQPAGVHRLHDRRLRSVRDAVRSQVVPAGAAVRERARRHVPPRLDGDSDSPDAVVGAGRAADDHADDQLQALEVHVPAKLGAQLLLRGARARPRRCSSARRSAIRSATTAWPRTCCSPPDGDPSVAVALLLHARLFPSFDLAFRRTAQRVPGLIIDGVNTLYLQHVLGASASTRMTYLQTPSSSGELSFGYDYTAYAPADPLPSRGSDGRHHRSVPRSGPDANCSCGGTSTTSTRGATRSAVRRGGCVRLDLRFSDPALGGRFRTTELAGSWQEYLTPPWARLHALALLWSGGIGIGDKRDFFGLGGFSGAGHAALDLSQPAAVLHVPARLSRRTASSATATRSSPPNTARRCSGSNAATRPSPPISASCGAPPSSTRATPTRDAFRRRDLKSTWAWSEPRPQPRLLPRDPDQDRLRPRLLRARRQPVVLPGRRVLLNGHPQRV